MKARKIAGLALACAVALGVAQPASAGLKIDLVYIDKPPPFYVAGGGSCGRSCRSRPRTGNAR